MQKVQFKGSEIPHWLVVGDDFLPISSISEYLLFLRNTGKSINTVRTYAHHLKLFWEYLTSRKLEWDKLNLDSLAYFVGILNGLVDNNVIYLTQKTAKRSARTINQILNAVSGFYQFHHRLGNVPDMQLVQWRQSFGSKKSYKPLLYHLNKSNLMKSSVLKLQEKKKRPQIVNASDVKKMIDACHHLRDKFLICLLYETGCRIGQALGLRHEDIETFNNTIIIRPRLDNLNLARAKTHEENTIHVSAALMQLYTDYYLNEYGDIDSDYVFINIWNGKIGLPISYSSVISLFQRLSRQLNIYATPHMLRHTHATELVQAGWSMAHVQKRLGHQDIQTTVNTYTHLTDKDLKSQYQNYLEKRGQQ